MYIMNSPFSVLSKPYCNYFYILTIFAFIWLIISVFASLYFLFNSFRSKDNNKHLTNFYRSLIPITLYFIVYFQNRLLYSMCNNSLT